VLLKMTCSGFYKQNFMRFFVSSFTMRFFNTLFLLLLGAIYFLWPELMQVEGFWFSIGAVWLCFFVSWLLFGGIADEIAGVNKYKDDEF
jgi:hypothetical protein